MKAPSAKASGSSKISDSRRKPPKIRLPEGTVDVSQLICDLRLHADDKATYAAVFTGLESIDRGAPVLIKGGSQDHEQLLTGHGLIMLNGQMLSWVLRGKAVALATLWERYPQYRQYLHSRTENFLYRHREETALLGLKDEWSDTQVRNLAEQLQLLIEEEKE